MAGRSLAILAWACLIPAVAYANVWYDNGFEVDTGDFTGSGSITRVASGAGTLLYPSSAGSYHAEITNLDDGYSTGYGDSQYTYFGGKVTTNPGQFWQAVDVYVDLSKWTPPTSPSVPAFWIDEAPANTSGASDYNAETNFRFYVSTTGTVDVWHFSLGNPGALIGTIDSSTGSGWYSFVVTYYKGPTYVVNEASIVAPNGSVIGTSTHTTPMLSADLGGNGYLWFTVWQNGFAGDTLAIDNVGTGLGRFPATAPVPTATPFALAILAVLLALAGGWIIRTR